MQQRQTLERAEYLDRMIPLDGASHAEAVSYSVDIPMRYSECFATLTDGSTVRLKNSRQFMGWSGQDSDCSLLFRSNGSRIVIDTGAGCSQSSGTERPSGVRKFVARDGSLLFIRHRGQGLAKSLGKRMLTYVMPVPDAEGLLQGASI